MKVKDIMTKEVQSVNANTSLGEVIKQFNENNLSHLAVTDSVETYKGIISKTDLLNRTQALLKSASGPTYAELELKHLKAKDVMTPNTVNLEKTNPIGYAAEILLQRKFHCLPVVHNFRLVGIVTKHDLLKGYYEQSAYSKSVNHE